MALRIETFDNVRGGNTLYKALTHPSAAGAGQKPFRYYTLAREGNQAPETNVNWPGRV